MENYELEFRKMAVRLNHKWDDAILEPDRPDGEPRAIEVSAYTGTYGHGGYVVAINGSPPRGTFVTSKSYTEDVFYIRHGRARRLSSGDVNTVHGYLAGMGYNEDYGPEEF